jgi:hypothetical protein
MQLDRSHADDSCAQLASWQTNVVFRRIRSACSLDSAFDRAAQTCAMRHSDSG